MAATATATATATPKSKVSAGQILKELKSLGSESIKKTLARHGIREPLFGVKIEHLKKVQNRIKMDYQLALDLYATGNYDAMYLAGLIADDQRMTRQDLQRWVEQASPTLCGFTVAWVAAGSRFGRELAMEWIESENPSITIAGWATLSSLVSIKPDEELDLPELKKLLQCVQKMIHKQADPVRYAMNTFVIAVGCGVAPLSDFAMKAAEQIGKVTVDMGDTDCKVPYAPDYIQKVKQRGTIGKKRRSAKC